MQDYIQEYFKVLGVSSEATKEEIDSAYNALKDKYSRDRFLEGEAGNEAARNLTRLEVAYGEIQDYFNKDGGSSANNIDFSEIEDLIRREQYSEAQAKLDSYSERNAEWHYLQSVVFYKKNWLNESKKQLEIALSIDKNNKKYKESYDRLNAKFGESEKQFHSGNFNSTEPNNVNNRQMGELNSCLTCCETTLCLNCLCNGCR